MTQEDLAARVGLDFSTIGAAERGAKNLSLKSLIKIAEALGVPIEELVRSPTANEQEAAKQELLFLITDMDPEQLEFIIELVRLVSTHIKKSEG